MRNLKVFLALGAGFAAAVVAACSSSSGTPATNASTEAGTDDSSTGGGDDSSTQASCIPLMASGLCPSKTDTCCLDLSSGIKPGVCEAPALCKSMIQVQCIAGANCAAGNICCATLGGGDGGSLAALADGGLGALGIDAAALMTEAGAASALANVSFQVTCQKSCTGGQVQACASAAECVGGGDCVPLSQLLATDAGGIDAGALAGGVGSMLTTLGMNKACVSTPSDAGPVVPDSGTDAASDAATTPDAPADAPAEAAH
jgi:hypothetical protein